jgi:hypothetical protein
MKRDSQQVKSCIMLDVILLSAVKLNVVAPRLVLVFTNLLSERYFNKKLKRKT